MKKHLFIFGILAVLFTACNDGVLVDRYHDISQSGWTYEEVFTDSFQVEKPNHYHLISANLRVSSDYTYSNIHLKIDVKHPDGKETSHKVPVILAEKSGKWLGSGIGNVLTFQTPILHRKFLNQKGQYTFTVSQDMRLELLPNVVSAGVRVEQQEEIF